MSAEKHVAIRFSFGRWSALGISTWDIKDGPRLRREMMRSSILNTPAEVRKWGRRHKLNVDREVAELEAKQAILPQRP